MTLAENPLTRLLEHPQLWRARAGTSRGDEVLPSGHPALDALLPGGGWPVGTLIELLAAGPGTAVDGAVDPGGRPGTRIPAQGVGAVTLLLPAVAALTARRRHVAMVAPPHIPYAPMLETAGVDPARLLVVAAGTGPGTRGEDALWAFEQLLGCSGCGMAFAWAAERLAGTTLRRLKLAAARGGGTGVLYRPASALTDPSPAALRLFYAPVPSATGDQRLKLEIVKAKGSARRRHCTVKLWPQPAATAVPP